MELSPGAYALIAVTDVGVGMTADVLTKALEPFFTTKPVGARHGGSTCRGSLPP